MTEPEQKLPSKCRECLQKGITFCRYWLTGFNCEEQETTPKPESKSQRLPTKHVKKLTLTAKTDNPGELFTLTAEAKPCQEVTVNQVWFKRNPNKKRLLRLKTNPFATLELFQYKDKPSRLGLAINGEFVLLNYSEAKLVYLQLRDALTKLKNTEET